MMRIPWPEYVGNEEILRIGTTKKLILTIRKKISEIHCGQCAGGNFYYSFTGNFGIK